MGYHGFEKLKKYRDRITKNKIVNKIYSAWFYFSIGRSEVDRYTSFIPEIAMVLTFLKVMGWNITWFQIGLLFIAFIFSLLIIGYLVKHLGLFDIDIKVQTLKNPVQKEIYTAAKKINNGGIICSTKIMKKK